MPVPQAKGKRTQRNKTGETKRNERQGEVQNSTQPRKKANESKATRSSTQHFFPRRPGNILHMPPPTRHLAEGLHRRGWGKGRGGRGREEDGPSLGLKDREARRGEDTPREPLNFVNDHTPKGDMTPTRLHSSTGTLQDGYRLGRRYRLGRGDGPGWGYRNGTVRTGQNDRQKGTRRRE